jgi:hypothetical protein
LNITAYKITDIQGRIVADESKIDKPVLELDGSKLKSGQYIIQVSTELGSTMRTFIIE